MIVTHDGIRLCADCMIFAVNGDASGLDYSYGDKAEARLAEITKGLEALGAHLVPDFDSESGRGIEEFRSGPCHCCKSPLSGAFYDFAILGEEGKAQ